MLKFYWLDDNPDRSPDATNMSEAIGADVEFCNLQNANLEQKLAELVAREQPALIILDHNLQDADRGVFKKGSTAAAFIRESWPECPIVCITGEDVQNLNSQQKALYEDVFSISRISDHYETIMAIAESFKLAHENRPGDASDIIKLLKAPDIDFDKLITVLPTTLKGDYADNSIIVEISRWIRGILIKRPGFLYNELWLSTLIGIKQESFHKVAEQFKPALYNGLFATNYEQRWWKSTAIEIIYDISDKAGMPWQAGRGIPGLEASDYSVCFYSGEEFPETVAFTDQSANPTEAPMKLKYTELHPEFERLLHFEDVRLMKAAE